MRLDLPLRTGFRQFFFARKPIHRRTHLTDYSMMMLNDERSVIKARHGSSSFWDVHKSLKRKDVRAAVTTCKMCWLIGNWDHEISCSRSKLGMSKREPQSATRACIEMWLAISSSPTQLVLIIKLQGQLLLLLFLVMSILDEKNEV